MAEGPSTSAVPPGQGTTIGGAKSRKKSDVLSLEFCTFRVPYAELNVKFRNGQKELDRAAASVAKAASLLTKKTTGANAPVPQDDLRKNFEFLLKQVSEAKKAFNNVVQAEKAEADKIILRAQRLEEEYAAESDSEDDEADGRPEGADRMERQKFARHICWHLLRCGMIEPAKMLVQEMNLEGLVDVDVFERIYEVEQALHAHNIEPCIKWCAYHNHRLRKINSRVEVVARQQEIVNFILEGNIPQALGYIKEFLVPITKTQFPDDLTRIMGAVAMPLEESKARNPELFDEHRFEAFAQFFVQEAYKLYQLPDNSSLATLVQMGVACNKTPVCFKDDQTPLSKQKCAVCRPDIWPMAEGLPYSRIDGNRILCSLSGTVCNDDDNIPYLFPTGHVVGLKHIDKELRLPDGRIKDPISRTEIDESQVLRLYFM